MNSEISAHTAKYNPDAWRDYSIEELGHFVHLLHKRASHRSDVAKRHKDLEDARNYWQMMGVILDEAQGIDDFDRAKATADRYQAQVDRSESSKEPTQ